MTTSQERKVAVVTGPTSGIGREIARELVRKNFHVVLACRDLARGNDLQESLKSIGPGTATVMKLDVAAFESIEAFADALSAQFPAVNVLINNAGAWFGGRQESVDGFELTLATNAIGPYRLTLRLADALARGGGRVVNIGSHLAGKLDIADLQITARRYDGFGGAYSASKQAFIMLSRQLHRQLSGRGITVNVAEPGWVHTNFHRNAFFLKRLVMNLAGSIGARKPAAGADTPLWVALAPELEHQSGRRFQDRKEIPIEFPDKDAELVAALETAAPSRAASP